MMSAVYVEDLKYNPTYSRIVLSIFHIPCAHHTFDEFCEPSFIDSFFQDSNQYLMINIIEITFDIELNKPLHSLPVCSHLPKSSVARSTWSKPM